MAKKSMIAREVKRIKTVERFAVKRAALKKMMNDHSFTCVEGLKLGLNFRSFQGMLAHQEL